MSVEDIRNNINLNKKIWIHNLTTNCYAYALGLDVKEKRIRQFAYMPGFIGKYYYWRDNFTLTSVTNGIYADMDRLNIGIREVDPYEEIAKDEWIIALYVNMINKNNLQDDRICGFHFLRRMEDYNWTHKPNYKKPPTTKDNQGNIITDVYQCDLQDLEYQKSFCLKLTR